jgi:glutaredoxin 3
MLDKWEIAYDEVMIDSDEAALKEFAEVTNGARTVPQIIIDGNPVGGFSELTELHMDGELDELMQQD